MKLTDKQSQILEMIKDFIEETGYPPTRAEISRAQGFSSANSAETHLKALAKKGAIELISGSSRGIRLPEEKTGLAVVGQVAAGDPILAEEHIDDYFQVDPTLFHPTADYFLRVKGMSMCDAGILDGDLLAVHSQQQAENGQIVVARVDNEVTVKRFHQNGPRVCLLPENDDFSPIKIDLRQQALDIEGIAVGLLRNHTLR